MCALHTWFHNVGCLSWKLLFSHVQAPGNKITSPFRQLSDTSIRPIKKIAKETMLLSLRQEPRTLTSYLEFTNLTIRADHRAHFYFPRPNNGTHRQIHLHNGHHLA